MINIDEFKNDRYLLLKYVKSIPRNNFLETKISFNRILEPDLLVNVDSNENNINEQYKISYSKLTIIEPIRISSFFGLNKKIKFKTNKIFSLNDKHEFIPLNLVKKIRINIKSRDYGEIFSQRSFISSNDIKENLDTRYLPIGNHKLELELECYFYYIQIDSLQLDDKIYQWIDHQDYQDLLDYFEEVKQNQKYNKSVDIVNKFDTQYNKFVYKF